MAAYKWGLPLMYVVRVLWNTLPPRGTSRARHFSRGEFQRVQQLHWTSEDRSVGKAHQTRAHMTVPPPLHPLNSPHSPLYSRCLFLMHQDHVSDLQAVDLRLC